VEAVAHTRLLNAAGLHARPCHAIVSAALRYPCELDVSSGGNTVSGRSILELMTLCAPCDTCLSFHARGPGAVDLVAELVLLVERGFGELP
jgi:phosphotransferase system HPr (HPr) family protein